MTTGVIGGPRGPESYLTHIRDVALLPGEKVNHLFCPAQGLTPEPPSKGQVLVATNQRILAFSLDEAKGDAFIVPLEDLRAVSLKAGVRSLGALLQGALFIVGAMFIYLVLAYWLTGRFQGPHVPVINMDAGALVVLAAAVFGVVYIGRHYFAKEAGVATFQGANWTFSFPYVGEIPAQQIYQVVNSVFADRRTELDIPLNPEG